MINIAIDGHVGSGKSSISQGIAKKLNLKVLNTGEIYRSLACAYKQMFNDEVTEKNIETFVKKIKVLVTFDGDKQIVYVNDKEYLKYLRLEEISLLTSKISQYQILRDKIVDIQKSFASKYNCIIEGRDIGTIVLPNADLKFFITASQEIRAKRRCEQHKEKGIEISYDEVLKDLKLRDYQDENRKVAPLKQASDAILIDTSEKTLEQSVNKCVQLIKDKLFKSNF